jgi:hypothetical protein
MEAELSVKRCFQNLKKYDGSCSKANNCVIIVPDNYWSSDFIFISFACFLTIHSISSLCLTVLSTTHSYCTAHAPDDMSRLVVLNRERWNVGISVTECFQSIKLDSHVTASGSIPDNCTWYSFCNKKVKSKAIPCSRPWMHIGLRDVENPTLSRQPAHS